MPSLFFFTDSVDVQRPLAPNATDSSGAPVTNFIPVEGLLGLDASIQPAGSSVKWYYAQREQEVTHEIFLDTSELLAVPSLKRGDRLFVNPGLGNCDFFIVQGWGDESRQGEVFVVHCYQQTG